MQRATFAVSLGLLASAAAGCGDDAKDTANAPAGASAAAPKAARPWHVVKTYDVPGELPHSSSGTLSYDDRGNAVAAWPIGPKDGAEYQHDLALLPVSADGKAGTPNRHDGFVFAGPVGAPNGDGEFVESGNNDDARAFSGLSVRRAGTDGAVDDVQQLLPHDNTTMQIGANTAVLAGAPGGASIVAWTQYEADAGPDGEERLQAAIRPRAGAAYGTPITLRLGPGGLNDPGGLSAAIDKDGRVAVVYADDGLEGQAGVQLWTGSATAGFGSPIELGEGSTTNEARTAITTTGRTIVAWGEYAHGEEPHSPWIVRSASVAAGETKPSRVDTIGKSTDVVVPSTNIELVAGPSGTALVAWTQYRGKLDTGNRIAEANATGRFGMDRDLPGDSIGGLAVREDGAAVVTVSDGGDADPAQWYALGRPPGGIAFGAVEPLAGGAAAAAGLTAPEPFYSPKTAQASIAWAEPGAAGKPARLVVQTRERQ